MSSARVSDLSWVGPIPGWGSSALRRATVTLAVTQLVSWGVLFYGFTVVAPEITRDTGWSEAIVAGAFTVGLLVSGFAAPAVAVLLGRFDPRLVLSFGSLLGVIGMVLFALAPNPVALYLAWIVIGLAMAATLYEPAMAVLVAIDPARRHRTLAAVTVAGGLASTLFAPLTSALGESLGWRQAIVVLAIAGGFLTLVLHGVVLPPAHVHDDSARAEPVAAPPFGRDLRALRTALVFEQIAVLATTAHLIGLLVDRGVSLGLASAALGVMGVGKVLGRLLLLGPITRYPLGSLAGAVNLAQLVGLAVPLVCTNVIALVPALIVVGVGSGATTTLRPLLVVDLVGAGPFAAVNARLQRSSTIARSAGPLLLSGAAVVAGWSVAWCLTLAAFAVAAHRYLVLGTASRGRSR
jgi:predicted MFS family arabinose efflux permease